MKYDKACLIGAKLIVPSAYTSTCTQFFIFHVLFQV